MATKPDGFTGITRPTKETLEQYKFKNVNDEVTVRTCDTNLADAKRTDSCEGDFIKTRAVAGPLRPSAAMSFQYAIEHLMIGVAWTRYEILISNLNDAEELIFYNGNAEAKRIRITCVPSGSDVRIVFGEPEYILQENGDFLLQENGDRLILEV